MNRLGSQATTTSLTPPPSDPPVNSSRLVSPDIPGSHTHMLIGNMFPKDYSHNCNADQIISLSHAHKRSNGDGDVTMRPTDDDGEDSDQGTVNGIINSTEDGFLQKPFRHIEEPTDIAGITKAADPPFTGAEAHMTEYDWIGTYQCYSLHSYLILCRASSTRDNPTYLAQTKFSCPPSSSISSSSAFARRSQAC